MNKYIIIILAALCFCACKKGYVCVLADSVTILTIENNSSHNITIKPDSKYISYSEINIPSGDKYVAEKCNEVPMDPHDFIDYRSIVIFDNDIEIVHSSKILMEHSLYDNNSYIYNKSKLNKYSDKFEYTYTFTDEDYDRAVAMNANAE